VPRHDPLRGGSRRPLLELDATLSPAHAKTPRRPALTVPVLRARRGIWAPPRATGGRLDGWFGVMVVDGLMVRTVRVSGLECCELLGPGDVLRPWDGDDDAACLASTVSWRALEDTHLAVLDEPFTRLAAQWPEVLAALMRRALDRSRSLTVQLAIAQARRADVRLMALFWHLADRWGRVTGDGVVLDLALTHGLLSRLTCLRRPTVSMTIKQLEASGELTRPSRSSWRIAGRQPALLGGGEPLAAGGTGQLGDEGRYAARESTPAAAAQLATVHPLPAMPNHVSPPGRRSRGRPRRTPLR
jgi:CRP/FNR family cyclic AMP-dependent transcriptional regulator